MLRRPESTGFGGPPSARPGRCCSLAGRPLRVGGSRSRCVGRRRPRVVQMLSRITTLKGGLGIDKQESSSATPGKTSCGSAAVVRPGGSRRSGRGPSGDRRPGRPSRRRQSVELSGRPNRRARTHGPEPAEWERWFDGSVDAGDAASERVDSLDEPEPGCVEGRDRPRRGRGRRRSRRPRPRPSARASIRPSAQSCARSCDVLALRPAARSCSHRGPKGDQQELGLTVEGYLPRSLPARACRRSSQVAALGEDLSAGSGRWRI